MKPIKPVKTYDDHVGYPSVAEAWSRRDFLKKALAGATALGGLLVLPPVAVAAKRHIWKKRKKKLFRVSVTLKHPYRFWSCQSEAYMVVLLTPSKRLVSFLGKKKESKGIQKAIMKALAGHGCHDLRDKKRLKRFHQRLGDALAAHYKKRTKRRVAAPGATLALRMVPPRPPVPGGMRPPHRP